MKLIKHSKFISGLCFICLSLLSCRRNIPCNDAVFNLGFIGFQDTETDTLILRRYTKADNFSTLIDTFLISSLNNSYYNKSNDTLTINGSFGNDGLKSKYDYEVYIPKINRIVTFSEITEEPTTHSVGLSLDKTTCNNPIKSYKINGQVISGKYEYPFLYITK